MAIVCENLVVDILVGIWRNEILAEKEFVFELWVCVSDNFVEKWECRRHFQSWRHQHAYAGLGVSDECTLQLCELRWLQVKKRRVQWAHRMEGLRCFMRLCSYNLLREGKVASQFLYGNMC